MDFIKQKFVNQIIVGAEVGVLRGDNASDILQNMPNIKLIYLVDPYQVYSEYLGDDACGIEDAKEVASQKLAPFKDRIRWIFKKFEDCSTKDIDQPLDFIYIDGNHIYEYVKQDIILATQLVKNGGVIGGHDAGAIGVDKAVTEYCERKKIVCSHGKGSDMHRPFEGWDWWFINALPA